MFWDKYPANMYYSTSRRGSLNASVLPPPPEVASYESPASDWTCPKVSRSLNSPVFCTPSMVFPLIVHFRVRRLTLPTAELFANVYWNSTMMPMCLNEAADNTAW